MSLGDTQLQPEKKGLKLHKLYSISTIEGWKIKSKLTGNYVISVHVTS